MVHSSLASKITSALQTLSVAEEGNIVANEKNKELAQTLLTLAEESKSQSIQDIEDPQLRDRVEQEEKAVKASRRRMRNLKGVLSGMIVGSGVDWANDEVLRELVMDDEDG